MKLDNESGDKLACWHANFTSDSFMSLSRSVSGPMNLLFETWETVSTVGGGVLFCLLRRV